MADEFTPAPAGGDRNRGPEFIRITWIECSIAIVFVSLRFLSRVKYTRKLWWDDWVILFTLVNLDTYKYQKVLLNKDYSHWSLHTLCSGLYILFRMEEGTCTTCLLNNGYSLLDSTGCLNLR